MQIIKSLTNFLLFFLPSIAFAQSTFIPLGDKGYHFLDRLEIKQQTNTEFNFSSVKPYNRKNVVESIHFIDSASKGYTDSATGMDRFGEFTDMELSSVDEYNMHSFLMNNSEWAPGSKKDFASKKPFPIKSFYKTKSNMIEVNQKDLFLVVNPLLQLSMGKSSDMTGHNVFVNSKGVSARGMLSKKLGFYTSLTDNQERGPGYFAARVNHDSLKAVPGVGFFKYFRKAADKNTSFDYIDARGYLTFNVIKHIDLTFGYDKNFIGNGYRSLFLSDCGNSYLFLKLNTKIWKFDYQNLFMELMPQFVKRGDVLLERKYAALHHLSMNVSKTINLGLFEGVIFGRKDHFDFQYLNPVIFYRHIEGTVGSPDNAVAGFDFKANIAHRFQFYGQFLLDEFVLQKIKENKGWWANKWALQLGAKYVDAFGIPNLDLQLETNRIRPFTYSHGGTTTVANYTHYNQMLAHPLGANLQEFIGIAHYQPKAKWYVYARLIAYRQGLDSLDGANNGFNPLENNTTRSRDQYYKIGEDRKSTCLNGLFQVSYEFKENLFFEASALIRNYTVELAPDSKVSMFTLGVRLNLARREYDY